MVETRHYGGAESIQINSHTELEWYNTHRVTVREPFNNSNVQKQKGSSFHNQTHTNIFSSRLEQPLSFTFFGCVVHFNLFRQRIEQPLLLFPLSLSLYLLLFRCAFCCDDDNDGGSNICRIHRTTWICWCHFIYWKSPIIVTNNLLLGAYRSQTDGLHSDRNYRDGRNETEIRREQERHTGRERDSRERARIHFLDTPFPNKVK